MKPAITWSDGTPFDLTEIHEAPAPYPKPHGRDPGVMEIYITCRRCGERIPNQSEWVRTGRWPRRKNWHPWCVPKRDA